MAQTGPEMLLNTLVKVFKLEAHVDVLKEQVKRAAEDRYLEKAKLAFEMVERVDARLMRIEQRLGIAADAGSTDEPGSSPGVLVFARDERESVVTLEPRTGTDPS